MEHRKPQAVSQKLDVVKQKAFIEAYETLMNTRPTDAAVMFADAVHPTHAVRPVGCWPPPWSPAEHTNKAPRCTSPTFHPKRIEGYRWQGFIPPAAGKIPPLSWTILSPPFSGDGVNIGARLENICEPGGIILSDDAYR
jgi:hypothetical protein